MACAITSAANPQYLIVSTSSLGDPLNCNCPGTYEISACIHPQQAEVASTPIKLGATTYGAALPWSLTTAGGQLDPTQNILSRTCFFHHSTGTTVHGDQPKVMKLEGEMSGGEMLVSAIAKQLAPCLGTVQAEPVAVGAESNASEFVSFAGRTLPPISPLQLKQLLAASNSPLVNLRSIRDTALDELNALAKSDGNVAQRQFLDALANSQTQVRALSSSLGSTLSSIKGNDVSGQALAAAALVAAKVTPVVTMNIPFGGDNHSDQNLQNEADQTVSGVAGIQALMTALAGLSLLDSVTFSTLNVFGRNLNGISKVESRAGRDHDGNPCVTVMIGKNVAPSVIGGIGPDASGNYEAIGINSSTGAASTTGDITADATHAAAAQTLYAALGIPQSAWTNDFVAGNGGKIVPSAVVKVP